MMSLKQAPASGSMAGILGLLLIALLFAGSATAGAPTPRYVIYYNSDATPLDALVGTPYTHVILSFLIPVTSADGRIALRASSKLTPFWSKVPSLQADGKKVLISFGGGEVTEKEYAPLVGHECELADQLAAFVKDHGLDGVDIDFEASIAFHRPAEPGVIDGRKFLVALNHALRQKLPAPRYLISHAPQPPFLDPDWHGGPYLDVLREAGDEVDWISVQYYDNPGFDNPMAESPAVTAYDGLVNDPRGLRWPSSKLVVGKPIYHDDAKSGHLAPEDVITTIIKPLRKTWGNAFGGLMGWQFSTLTADHQAWNDQVGKALLGTELETTRPTVKSPR
jgi:chitinase